MTFSPIIVIDASAEHHRPKHPLKLHIVHFDRVFVASGKIWLKKGAHSGMKWKGKLIGFPIVEEHAGILITEDGKRTFYDEYKWNP